MAMPLPSLPRGGFGEAQPLRPLATPRECAAFLGVSLSTLRRETAAGRIPVIPIGKRRPRYDLDEVKRATRKPPAG